MHDRSHAIIRLPVHLPMQQNVYFNAGEEEQALAAAENQATKLTAWCKLNPISEEARQLLYAEVPCHYVFKSNTNS